MALIPVEVSVSRRQPCTPAQPAATILVGSEGRSGSEGNGRWRGRFRLRGGFRLRRGFTASRKPGWRAVALTAFLLAGPGAWALNGVFGTPQPVGVSSSSQSVTVTAQATGTVATVEWVSSLSGPWTNTWAGLDAVTVDSNGMISVSVPMFYRVRGMAQVTNPAPAGMVLIPAGSFTMGNSIG